MRERGRKAGVLGVAAAFATVGCLLAPGFAQGAASCRLDQDVLEIDVPRGLERFAAVTRGAGGELVISDSDGVVECGGSVPTVTNTRKVLMLAPKGARSVAVVNLDGGPLAPGAGAEPGAAEIEFTVSLRDRFDIFLLLGRGGRAGGVADDRVRLGSRRGHGRVNLNPAAERSWPDADVELLGANRTVVFGQGGDDRLDGSGGKGTGSSFRSGQLWTVGAGGRDRLRTGSGSDLLSGGAGADRLRGARGVDVLIGGGAVDRFAGGRGDDFIRSRDRRRERVRCGRGRQDVVERDRKDRLARSCEFELAGTRARRAAAAPETGWATPGLAWKHPPTSTRFPSLDAFADHLSLGLRDR